MGRIDEILAAWDEVLEQNAGVMREAWSFIPVDLQRQVREARKPRPE